MMRILRQGQRWIIAALIGTVGLVFVVTFGVGTGRLSRPSDTVIAVGKEAYSLRHVARIRSNIEEQYRKQMKIDSESKEFRKILNQTALQTAVQQAILTAEAKRLGIVVGDDEVRATIQSYFSDESGKFSLEQYRDYTERNFGSQHAFEEVIREDLRRTKLIRIWNASVAVSDLEARDAALAELEQVQIAFIMLDAVPNAAEMEISDAQIKTYFAKNKKAVRALYDERLAQYNKPERVRARHILLRHSSEASAEELAVLKRKIEAIRERIVKGEDFAKVATEESEDPGTKQQGGDLGFFTHEQMVPEFAKAAFALAVGEVSQPVETNFGYHLIRVEEKIPASVQLFEEVQNELAKEKLAQERAQEHREKLAQEIAAEIEKGRKLIEVAQERQINIERTDLFARNESGYVPILGRAPEVQAAAFALSLDAPSPAEIFHVDGKPVLIELLDHVRPPDAELALIAESKKKELLAQRRQSVLNTWITKRRDELEKSKDLQVFPELLEGNS